MAEWSNAAVLKTVEGHTSGGSNPSFSAKVKTHNEVVGFLFSKASKACFRKRLKTKNQIRFSVFRVLYFVQEPLLGSLKVILISL